MTLDDLIQRIGDDLQNEWKHLQYYLHHMNVFRGVAMLTLKPLFEEEMRSEVEHVKQFSDLLVKLNAVPVLHENGAPGVQHTTTRDIIQHAHDMEVEVAQNYLERIKQAEEVGGVEGKMVQLFYEEQLDHSYSDAQKFRKILEGLNS